MFTLNSFAVIASEAWQFSIPGIIGIEALLDGELIKMPW
jgi:hypothetical protein